MTFYRNGNFQAECTVHEGRCALTRKGRDAKRADKGRPLGLLMSWLAAAPIVDTREEHFEADVVAPDYERRRFFREELAAVEGSQALFQFERGWDPEGGDPWEPPLQI